MYKKILVPLDGSVFSESALKRAKAIVSDCSVPEMVLLTVVDTFRDQPYNINNEFVAGIRQEELRAARDYLERVAKDLKLEGINAETVAIEGNPAPAILDYIIKNGVDLIVISSHGRSGPSRWFFGSVANRVILSSPVPVLVVPPSNPNAG
jgi:nucleotide-binding universal stress UspA family protein